MTDQTLKSLPGPLRHERNIFPRTTVLEMSGSFGLGPAARGAFCAIVPSASRARTPIVISGVCLLASRRCGYWDGGLPQSTVESGATLPGETHDGERTEVYEEHS